MASARWSAPGKIFVLGEYAALAGVPSVIAAVGPRFALRAGLASAAERFHPQSPAGKLLAFARSRAPEAASAARVPEFVDAHGGQGGFGGSTAEFLLLHRMLASALGWDASWQGAWTLYRELTAGEALPPSGADLVVQAVGGAVRFDPSRPAVESLGVALAKIPLLVFSAAHQPARKVATHAHLHELAGRDFPRAFSKLTARLGDLVDDGTQAIRAGNSCAFGAALTEYAEALAEAELEIPATREDRAAFAALAGVLGAKGAGALQADALLVALDPARPEARAAVLAEAERRELRKVAESLGAESGLRPEGLLPDAECVEGIA